MWKKVILRIFCTLLIIGSGVAGFVGAKVRVQVDNSLGLMTHDVDTSLKDVQLDDIPVKSDNKIINILVVGDDYREYDGSTSPGLTDVIMIATMDKKHNSLKLTSIMRDTLVENARLGKYTKINASSNEAYGGIKNLYKTIALNYNIKVDGYAKIGFDAFKNAVDAVGGVEVEITDTEARYLRKTNYIVKKKNRKKIKVGKQKLNGDQALGYCRIRKGMDIIGEPVVTANGLTDDYGRTWRQRTLLAAVFDKMKSQPLSKWVEVANSVLKDVTTDLDDDTIIKYMKDVIFMGTAEIKQFRIPMDGYFYDDKGNEFPDAEGWSLVPNDGVTRSYDPSKNEEALHDFIFYFDGKGEYTYSSSSSTSDSDDDSDDSDSSSSSENSYD